MALARPDISASSEASPDAPALWARIIIVSYNSGSDLQKCIDSLAGQSCQDFEVFIIDNNSPDEAVRDLNLPNERYYRHYSETNDGFAGASNFGAKTARTEWVITLNPDAWPEPNWLENLKAASEAHPDFSMLSSTLIQADTENKLDGFGDYLTIFGLAKSSALNEPDTVLPAEPVEVFGPCGAAAAYRREIFLESGGFDARFFCYLEDVDLAYRLRLFGEKCLQCPGARAHHVGSSSTGKQFGFKFYHSNKNNVPLVVKNTPLLLLFIMFPLFLLSQTYLIYRNKSHPNFRDQMNGFRDGLKDIPAILKQRRQILPRRKVGSLKIAKRLSWSIRTVQDTATIYWPVYKSR